jgi:hypothetical protein
LGNAVVYEQNSGTWEFAKGALRELRFCGAAVFRSKGGEVRGWRLEVGGKERNAKGERVRVRLRLRLKGLRREGNMSNDR